jgi:hypothetical protein
MSLIIRDSSLCSELAAQSHIEKEIATLPSVARNDNVKTFNAFALEIPEIERR